MHGGKWHVRMVGGQKICRSCCREKANWRTAAILTEAERPRREWLVWPIGVVLPASDLTRFLVMTHSSALDLHSSDGERSVEQADDSTQLLHENGNHDKQVYLAQLRGPEA